MVVTKQSIMTEQVPMDEDDVCPLCMDVLPPVTWRDEERVHTWCCGALICKCCSKSMHRYANQNVQNLQDSLAKGILDEVRIQEIYSLLSSNKCPLCRTYLPQSNMERFAMVQRRVQEHPDWNWPLYRMGKFYEFGYGCPKNVKIALAYYKKGAKRGDARAQHELGNCYTLGMAVPKSARNAMRWYTQAANQGLGISQYSLGEMYNSQQNYSEAIHWFSLAAEQGLDTAQYSLAFCYQHGNGVESSLEKSIYWNKKAADQGHTSGMVNYAATIMAHSANNNGGRFDLVGKSVVPEALYWVRKAVSLGFVDDNNMVAQVETAVFSCCTNCGLKAGTGPTKFSKCSQCKAVLYCTKECQAAHWKKGHRWDCVDKDGTKKSQ